MVQARKTLHLTDYAEVAEGDTAILSIEGDTDQLLDLIATAIEEGYWDPLALLSIGFKNDLAIAQGHLLFLATDRTNDLNKLKAAVPNALFARLLRKDLFYVHLMATMADGVSLGAFDKGFEQMFDSDRVFRRVVDTLFIADNGRLASRSLHASSTEATSLVLLGNMGKRVVVAAHATKLDALRVISTPTTGPARYATVDENVLVVAPYGGSKLFGLHAIEIACFLDGDLSTLSWRSTSIDGQVAELAIVDGVLGKLLLTLNKSPNRYVPVGVRFTQGLLALTLDLESATPVADHEQPPIVRINAEGADGHGHLAHVDREGEYVLTYSTIADAAVAHSPFARTATSVTSDAWDSPVPLDINSAG